MPRTWAKRIEARCQDPLVGETYSFQKLAQLSDTLEIFLPLAGFPVSGSGAALRSPTSL